MKIYKTQKEIEADIKDGVLKVEDDVRFECSFSIRAKLEIAGNIDAWDISAENINAGNINAQNINAQDISARDISAGNIDAWDISAWDINAGNINAQDINAQDISARDISFYACCYACAKFVCKSIVGRRENSKYFSLDGEVEIKPDKPEETLSGKIFEVKIDGKEYKARIE